MRAAEGVASAHTHMIGDASAQGAFDANIAQFTKSALAPHAYQQQQQSPSVLNFPSVSHPSTSASCLSTSSSSLSLSSTFAVVSSASSSSPTVDGAHPLTNYAE